MNGFCRCGSVGSMQVLTRCKCVNDVADVQTALRPLCACDDEIWDGWWWFLWEKRKKKVPCVLFVVYSSWKGETSKTRNNLVIKTVAFHRRAIKSVYSGLRTPQSASLHAAQASRAVFVQQKPSAGWESSRDDDSKWTQLLLWWLFRQGTTNLTIWSHYNHRL